MRILIIEDNEYKYNDIKDTLNRVLNFPITNWEKSRNSGLVSIMQHNFKENVFEPYDVIILDNYMPLDDDERDIEPFASDIVSEIRRMGLKDLPIIVCSSEEVENCDYNYKIKYDSSVLMDEIFKLILDDLAAFKQCKESSISNDCRSCQNMSCRVENSEKPVDNCVGYIYHKREPFSVLIKKRK